MQHLFGIGGGDDDALGDGNVSAGVLDVTSTMWARPCASMCVSPVSISSPTRFDGTAHPPETGGITAISSSSSTRVSAADGLTVQPDIRHGKDLREGLSEIAPGRRRQPLPHSRQAASRMSSRPPLEPVRRRGAAPMSAPDHRHRSRRAEKTGFVDSMAGELVPHHSAEHEFQFVIGPAVAQKVPHGSLVVGEEAVSQ